MKHLTDKEARLPEFSFLQMSKSNMRKKQNQQDLPSNETDSNPIREQPADALIPPVENQLRELQAHQIELEIQNDELLQSRDRLEESRDRYADFYDFAPVAYLTLSHKALINEINLTGAVMLGEEPGQLRRRRFAEFVAPEDNDFWNRHFMVARQQDGKLTCELRIQLGDGSRSHVQIDSLRLKRDGHEPVVRIALTDITELKRAEAALRESETQLRLLEQREIVRTSLDGFFVVDTRNAQIIEVNDAFCHIVGYSREELLAMSIPDLEVNESPAATAAHIKKIMVDGYDRFETRHRHKLGHLLDVEISVSYSELDGGINHVFVRDITERKQAERQLHELAMHLQTVREEEKAHLAREIHDELSGTLAALKIETEMLAQGLSDKQKKIPLFARVQSMTALLDDVYVATRRIITDLRPPQLDDLGLLAALKWQAEQFNKRTNIECWITCTHSEICEGCVACKGKFDEMLSITLFRIFQESLANVARHSGASTVIAQFHPTDSEIVLSIQDDGCGLPEGHTIAPTSYGIRGMRERVEQLGGKITFDSPPGGGLAMLVKLPQPAERPSKLRNIRPSALDQTPPPNETET